MNLANTQSFVGVLLRMPCVAALVIAFSIALPACATEAKAPPRLLAVEGIRLNVTDLEKAKRFYVDVLGFSASQEEASTHVVLQSRDGKRLYLVASQDVRPYEADQSYAKLTLQVNNLDRARESLLSRGVRLVDKGPRTEGVGIALTFADPFGLHISMMQVTIRPVPAFDEPRIYNQGLMIQSMEGARKFFTAKLGLLEQTTRFLPGDMPLRFQDNAFAFMLHQRDWVAKANQRSAQSSPLVILIAAPDPQQTSRALSAAGVGIEPSKWSPSSGPAFEFETVEGIPMQIVPQSARRQQ